MKIVVPVDGSHGAKHGLSEALKLAPLFREPPEIHVISVVDHITPPGGLGKAPPGAPDLLAEEAETALAIAREMATEKGVPIEARLLRGHAAAQILAYSEEVGAEFIVMGRRGGGFARVLGSVCDQVIRESPIPVMTVHDPSRS